MVVITTNFHISRFEASVPDEEDENQIAIRLKIAIDKITAEGEGGIAINSTEEERKFAEETMCKFFGDYPGIRPPLNLAQAKDTILEIERDDTNSLGVPIHVTLTPLSSLTSAPMKIVTRLSADAVNESIRLIEDFEDIQFHMKKAVNSYERRGSELKSKLCEILPRIKANGGDEIELMEVIRMYNESPFSKARTMECLKNLPV